MPYFADWHDHAIPFSKIPSYITNLPKKAFKRGLRKLLFDILEIDDFIEIPLIVKIAGT